MSNLHHLLGVVIDMMSQLHYVTQNRQRRHASVRKVSLIDHLYYIYRDHNYYILRLTLSKIIMIKI